jgi:hypothetical protein
VLVDTTYTQLVVVLLYNLSFGTPVVEKIKMNSIPLLTYVGTVIETNRKSKELVRKVTKSLQQFVKITQAATVFDEYREQLFEICRIAGIAGHSGPNVIAIVREFRCDWR